MLRRVALAFIAMSCLTVALCAQTADEIIAKNIEAHGGAAKIKAVQTIKAEGKIEIGPGIIAPGLQYQKRPLMMRRDFTLQGLTQTEATDGKQAWKIVPFMGKKDPELMTSEQRDEIMDDADIDGPLMDYAQKGHKVEALGKDNLEGTDVYKLRVTLKDGAVMTYYIDTDSNLEIRIDSERSVRGSMKKSTVVIGDYKQIEGVYEPFSFEISEADHPDEKQRMTMDKIEINVPLEDSLFHMPGKTASTTKGAETVEPKTSPEQKPDETPKAETPKQ